MTNISQEQRRELAEAFAPVRGLFWIEEAAGDAGEIYFDLHMWGRRWAIGQIIPAAEGRLTLIINDDGGGYADIFRTPQEIVKRLMRGHEGKAAHNGEATVSL